MICGFALFGDGGCFYQSGVVLKGGRASGRFGPNSGRQIVPKIAQHRSKVNAFPRLRNSQLGHGAGAPWTRDMVHLEQDLYFLIALGSSWGRNLHQIYANIGRSLFPSILGPLSSASETGLLIEWRAVAQGSPARMEPVMGRPGDIIFIPNPNFAQKPKMIFLMTQIRGNLTQNSWFRIQNQ